MAVTLYTGAVPTTEDPDNFDAAADALLPYLAETLPPEINSTAAQVNSDATTASTAAATATAAAAAAAASASAAEDADSTQTTSTTSLTITASASRTFNNVGAALSFVDGMYLLAASDANPDTHWMSGRVTSYSGTTLIVKMDDAATANLGATRADWVISKATQAGRAAAAVADVYAATGGVSLDPETLIGATDHQLVTYSASPAWPVLTEGYTIYIDVTGGMVVPAPSVLRSGMVYTIWLIMDAVGGHVITFDSIWDAWGDAGAPDITTTANAVTIISGPYSSVTGKIHANHRKG